ncbi:NfeD family protein [Streptomyces litchfieldiae]|uniref:NfeD family protein n=1 Tax=Streptomyces litchfieldiae TaxID=3075543 RepID=A0ABU2MTB8_9ACTN|nr:NfeD family protein [Streptomyces sp. DSM 44938]MDT0344882.1 NfeD family protein [Streptomyces sp. DSM 44938]
MNGKTGMELASPELAYLFLAIGILAVVYELASPGVGVAGAAGVLLLAAGFVALGDLSVNPPALTLLLLAAVLCAAELITPWVGLFALAGTAALLATGVLLFRGEDTVDPAVLWSVAPVTGAGALLAGRLAVRARRSPPAAGAEALIGREAVVRRAEGGTGQVLLEGAWWTVRGRTGPVTEGRRVRVVGREGLELIVDSAEEEPP